MPEQGSLEEAVEALESGQRHKAKDLLTRLLRSDEVTVDHWLWMSAAVDTEKEQIFCLQKALKIDPGSVAAKRGLVVLGAMSPEDAALPSADGLETVHVKAPAAEKAGPAVNPRLALYGLGSAALLVVCLGLVLFLYQVLTPHKAVVVVTSVPTTTALPSPTPAATLQVAQARCTPPATVSVATPLAAYFCVTLTPTSISIPTDQATIEDYSNLQHAYLAGKWSDVISLKDAAIKAVPNSGRVYFYVAEAYRNTGDQRQAAQNYNTSINKDGAFAPAYWGRAMVTTASASDDFKQAIKIDASFIPAYVGLAQFYSENGNVPQAVSYLEQAKAAAPGNALAQAFLALAYVDNGQAQAALAMAGQALVLDAGMPLAYYARGRAEYALGQFAAADQDLSLSYQYVLTLDAFYPDLWQANVYYAYGLDKVAIGDDDGALVYFNDAFGVRQSSPPLPLYVDRGRVYLRKQNYDAAAADFNKVISQLQGSKDPMLLEAYLGNGLAWLGRSRPDSALSNFQMVVKLDPTRFEGSLYLGQSLLLTGKTADALDALTTALSLAQDDGQRASAYQLRSQVYQALGRPIDQVADLAQLLALQTAPAGAAATAQAQLTQIGPQPSVTASPTLTPTVTLTPGVTPTVKMSPTLKSTATAKMTATPKVTATRTATATGTPTLALTPGVLPASATFSAYPGLTLTPTRKGSP